jgi:hypothetical protein
MAGVDDGRARRDLTRALSRTVASYDCASAAAGSVGDQPGGSAQRRPSALPGQPVRSGGLGSCPASETLQAGGQAGALSHNSSEARRQVVAAANRGLAEA